MRISAATGLIASLLTAGTAQGATHQGGLHLGKIQYNSPGTDTRSNTSLNGEWVELHNNGRTAVQLRGFKLKDDAGHTYTFGSFKLAARKTVRVHTGRGKDGSGHRYWNRRSYVWNNTSDRARLLKPSGTRLDSCAWTTRDHGSKMCH
ncbi:lamin tail domain-containing protein [Streptomyces sp. NPDC006879]|uniref:lamin tail domain-containing protein n=1 Tax=Streptomyces sp. NPDC006879 TaxID=3364767 RepID=UPI0036CB5A5D